MNDIFEIDGTNLYFIMTEDLNTYLSGYVSFYEELDSDNLLYHIQIKWDGTIHFRILQEQGLNMSASDNYIYIGDIEEISAIMNFVKNLSGNFDKEI